MAVRTTADEHRASFALRRVSRTPSTPPSAWSDVELMAGVAQGDAEAFGQLYDRFAPKAYGLALRVLRDRELAEDAVQEAFLSVWRSAPRFDRRRGPARAWVLMLVHRRAVDLVQRTQRQRDHANDEGADATAPSAAEAAELNLERHAVQTALEALPAKQRTALALAYYAGYTQQEIASCVNVPIGTIKSQTFDGLRRLQQLLGTASRRSA